MTAIGYRKAQRMDHQVGFRVYKSDYEQLEQIAAARETTVTELCRLKVAEILDEEPSGILGKIYARLERIERMLEDLGQISQICPSENRQGGASNESAVGLDVQNPVYLLSEWVNEEQMIICPHCSSLDSDWADDDEANPVRSIGCYGCGARSYFEMEN